MDYDEDESLSRLLNMDMSGLSFDGVDLSALEGMDLSGLNNLDLSGLLDVDMSGLSFEGLDPSMLEGVDPSVLEGLGLSQSDDGGGGSDVVVGDPIIDEARGSGDGSLEDLSYKTFEDSLDDMDSRMGGESESGTGLSRRLNFDGSNKLSVGNKFGNGINMKPTITGRGEVAYKDPNDPTGATGLKSEYFRNINDLLETGTPEQIARLTSGAPDANDLFKGTGGEGFNADATRGPGLESMGGGQGLSKYIPADYDGKGNIQKGTGGTLTQFGFLPDKGTRYAIGDPGSWINNPAKTGEKAIVSPGNVVRSTGDPSKPTTVTTEKGQTPVVPGENKNIFDKLKDAVSNKSSTGDKKNDLSFLLPLLLAMMAMNRGGGSSSGAVIPSLSADRKQLPYGPSSGEVKRPGAGGTTYFSPTTYTKKAAGGGMMYGGGGISNLGGYSDGGRLLRGPGDGVSDSIPATIGGKQPARLATGEFVVPARIVSELGNGSTEAGAKKLYAMMDRVQKARRKTKNVAADTKAHKYLPA